MRFQKKTTGGELSRIENRPVFYLNTINSDDTNEGAQALGYVMCAGVDNDCGSNYLSAGTFLLNNDAPSDR